MDVPTPNILSFFFSNWKLGTLIIVVHAWEVGFNRSKRAINSGIIIFASYLEARQIITQWFKDLKQGSNIMASMLWTLCKSNVFKSKRKGLITLMTSCYISFCKVRSFESNSFRILNPSSNPTTLTFMLNEILTIVVKASDKSQCPFDWFITHAFTIKFRQEIIAFAIAQTWALRTPCCNVTIFCLP